MRTSICICLLALLFACAPPPKSPTNDLAKEPLSTGQDPAELVDVRSGGSSGGGSTGAGASHTQEGSRPAGTAKARPPGAAARLLRGGQDKVNTTKPRPFSESSQLAGYDEVSLLYPAPLAEDSLKRGDRLYKKYCDSCHGVSGLPSSENATLARYAMADLRDPGSYKFGDGKRAIFRSISYGTKDSPMMGYKDQMSKAEIWDLTSYITRKFQKRKD